MFESQQHTLHKQLHAHTLGRALELKHIRNGIELPPIAVNWAYDFVEWKLYIKI